MNLRQMCVSIIKRFQTRPRVHAFWMKQEPKDYLDGMERSRFLVRLVEHNIVKTDSILELGCNIGRNLHFLVMAGFGDVHGIEINADAVRLMPSFYPELEKADITNGPLEEELPKLDDNRFDLIFSMAVLEHIHPSSTKIFDDMARAAKKFIITIEDEQDDSPHHYARDYKAVFEHHGFFQIQAVKCSELKGMTPSTVARVFKKATVL